MDEIQILGLAAAALTTIANFPQAYKIIKTKNTRDISAVTYALLLSGLLLWLAYGIIKSDLPIIIGNGIAATLAGTILFLKFVSPKVLDALHDSVVPENDKPENQ